MLPFLKKEPCERQSYTVTVVPPALLDNFIFISNCDNSSHLESKHIFFKLVQFNLILNTIQFEISLHRELTRSSCIATVVQLGWNSSQHRSIQHGEKSIQSSYVNIFIIPYLRSFESCSVTQRIEWIIFQRRRRRPLRRFLQATGSTRELFMLARSL